MELIRERERLEDEGKICVLGGSYNNGGAVGIQYEYISRLGRNVYVSNGSDKNLKINTMEDVAMFRALYASAQPGKKRCHQIKNLSFALSFLL